MARVANRAKRAVAKSATKQRKTKGRAEPPKKKLLPACNQCSAAHNACDRTKPTCQRCAAKSVECTWKDEDVEAEEVAENQAVTVKAYLPKPTATY